MSEKRFVCGLGFPINSDDPIRIISDSVEDKDYCKFLDICNVLNEQQATNSALRTENNHLIDVIKEYAKKYEEQQSTIDQLQEENASLKQRIRDIKYNNCD